MSLGDKIGLFCRTILVPVTRTTLAGSDQSCFDAERTLRSILYKRPAELSQADFAPIYTSAAGKPRVIVQILAVVQLLVFSLIAAFVITGYAPVPKISLVPLALVMYTMIHLLIKHRRAAEIPSNTEANKVRDAWLQAQRCPSCGYSLSATTNPASSSKRCNECGALWHLPQPQPPIPPPSALSAPPRETPPSAS